MRFHIKGLGDCVPSGLNSVTYVLVGRWMSFVFTADLHSASIIPNWMESHKIPWFQTTKQ